MITTKVLTIFLVCFLKDNAFAMSFPGPRVYVVTPAPRPFQHDDANPAPFYYHNWMRRMDSEENVTASISATTTPKAKTPDLIFAEFESDANMKKSIRKLLEKEQILSKTQTSTTQPIYVPEDESKEAPAGNYGLPISIEEKDDDIKEKKNSDINYFPMYNNLYNKVSEQVYLPTTRQPSTTVTSTTTSSTPINVENIWHIIDNEKLNHYSGNWDEVAVPSNGDASDDTNSDNSEATQDDDHKDKDTLENNNHDEALIDDNFALPGFATNSGNGAENESRAIRTEQNIRFPYVNLKPFQMKKSMLDIMSNSKKGNNLYTNLDNFFEMKNPVRGEAQDVDTITMNQSVDRYNPAQPYLPQPYGSKSKQSNPISSPPKSTASLVPPPPPPPTGTNFPSPTSYESFPPYLPPGTDFGAPSPSFPSVPASPPVSAPSPIPLPPPPSNDVPIDTYSGPGMDDDGASMDIGYRYKPPSPTSSPQFLPTVAPESKPFKGYSYGKPASDAMMTMDHAQDTQGYHYTKPKPSTLDQAPNAYDSPPSYGSLDSVPTYGHLDSAPDHHDSDYPEIVFHKNHGHIDSNGDIKDHDTGMMPPDIKPDAYGAPPSDLGFPSDFPGDFKFPHDFDDHDHHYQHPTSTTEMPRVNRFSYYYLGKKLYYLPLYFSVYFIIYVGALIIKAVLRHKIVYPNSWRPNTTTATFFSKRSVDDYFSHDNMHEMTGRVTHAIATAAEKYMNDKRKLE